MPEIETSVEIAYNKLGILKQVFYLDISSSSSYIRISILVCQAVAIVL